MINIEKTRNLISEHIKKYPKLEICDVFKFLHQSCFGCEHMISSGDMAVEYIKKEAEAICSTQQETESLGENYSRVHLGILELGMSAETLGKLFYMSSKKEENAAAELSEKLKLLMCLSEKGELPFDKSELCKAIKRWEEQGYCALHHSESFREAYKPSYRVVSNRLVPCLPLFSKIDKALKVGNVTLAIDGPCGSGKTTLAGLLSELYDCNVYHIDDFFLQGHQRSAVRLSEIGGNFDRERFLSEVLLPHSEGKEVRYRKYDCSCGALSPEISVIPKKLTVIEGSYSMHTALSPYYSLSVFMDISPSLQHERILKRSSPELAKNFFERWIPMENEYFEVMNVKERCDIVIKND